MQVYPRDKAGDHDDESQDEQGKNMFLFLAQDRWSIFVISDIEVFKVFFTLRVDK